MQRSGSGSRRAGNASQFNEPALWTKEDPKRASRRGASSRGHAAQGAQAQKSSPLVRILQAILGVLVALLGLVGRGLAALFGALFNLIRSSKVAACIAAVVCVVLVGTGVDTALNWGKIYPGVKVGTVEVAGLTPDEAQSAIEDAYGQRLAQASTVVYASEDARAAALAGQGEQAGPAEQQSVEEQQQATQQWNVTSAELGASLPAADLAAEAMEVGRSDGGALARVKAQLFGFDVPVRAAYEETLLEGFATSIDGVIGSPRVDWNIVVEDGTARVTEGTDGQMVDRDELASQLDSAFLTDGEGDSSFVAYARYAPLRIDKAAAQAVCDRVNSAIADGAALSYGSSAWQAAASAVGGWVTTRVEGESGSFELVPCLDASRTKSDILYSIKENNAAEAVEVSFEVSADDAVTVRTASDGTIPLVAQAVSDLDAALFGTGEVQPQEGANAADGKPVSVTIASSAAPDAMTFDEALELGVVSLISEYTTEYTTGAGTENRNHNIHLAADLLNNSVAKADGGLWSFNGTSGNYGEEEGFKAAGAIVDGVYVDSVGGGVCQVATTVFNAVYEAGYPVPMRFNHSLYIASYPTGRDAAVSYDTLDLRWTNDSSSDVLVRTSHTDSTVTVALYGVDPGYSVASEAGEWEEGEEFVTKYVIDDSLAEGKSYVKTSGTNGRSVSVTRTVYDHAGTVLHTDTFYSSYDPKNEVKAIPPGEEADEARRAGLLMEA